MNKKIKKAIILAGGKGTRLYPVTLETPKPLLTVNKRPIINYLIDMFKKHGVEEIAITVRKSDFDDFSWWLRRWQNDLGGVWVNPHTNNLNEQQLIKFSLGNFNSSLPILYSKVSGVGVNLMMEEEPMGTIGYWAHHLHTWTGNEPFFLTNGDELKDIDLSAMAEHHHKSGAKATIAAVEVPNPSEYGVIVFDGDRVERFLEKPKDSPGNFISSGLYLLNPEIHKDLLSAVESGEKFLMIEKDLFPKLAESKELYAFKSDGKWFDCGNLERWEKAIKEWGLDSGN